MPVPGPLANAGKGSVASDIAQIVANLTKSAPAPGSFTPDPRVSALIQQIANGTSAPVAHAQVLPWYMQDLTATAPQNKATPGKGHKGKGAQMSDLPYDTRNLLLSRDRIEKQSSTDNSKSFFNRLFDVMSRGQYATATFADELAKGHGIGAAGKGILQGLEGKRKTSFTDVARDAGIKNSVLDMILGTVGDIAFDPLTYTGVGAVGKVGKAAELGKAAEDAMKAGSEAEKLGVTLKTGNKVRASEEALYRGVRDNSQYTIDHEGNLILHPGQNFSGKTTGISLTPNPGVAIDYSGRGVAGPVRTNTGLVFKVNKDAVDPNKLFQESGEEVATRGNEPLFIPANKWHGFIDKGAHEDLAQWEEHNWDNVLHLSDEELAHKWAQTQSDIEQGENGRLNEFESSHATPLSAAIEHKYGKQPDAYFYDQEIKSRAKSDPTFLSRFEQAADATNVMPYSAKGILNDVLKTPAHEYPGNIGWFGDFSEIPNHKFDAEFVMPITQDVAAGILGKGTYKKGTLTKPRQLNSVQKDVLTRQAEDYIDEHAKTFAAIEQQKARDAAMDYAKENAKLINPAWTGADHRAWAKAKGKQLLDVKSHAEFKQYAEKQNTKILKNKYDEYLRKHHLGDLEAPAGPNSYYNKMAQAKREELFSILNRNIDPKIEKQLGVHLGKMWAGIPLSSQAIKGVQAVAGLGPVEHGLDTWARAFQATKGMDPAVRQIMRGNLGDAARLTDANKERLRGVWDKVSPGERKRFLDNYVQGNHTVTNEVHGGNGAGPLGEWFDSELKRMKQSVSPLGLSEFESPFELNHWLPRKLQFEENVVRRGKKGLNPNWLEDQVKVWSREGLIKDPVEALHSVQTAIHQASARNAIYHAVIHHFGHTIKKMKPTGNGEFKALDDYNNMILRQNHGYRQAMTVNRKGQKIPIRRLQGITFHPEIAKSVEVMERMLHDHKQMNEFTRLFDKGLQFWKGAITKFNPGYHERNLMGEMFTSYLAGVHNPERYRQAALVLKGRYNKFLGPAALEPTHGNIRAFNNAMMDPATAARNDASRLGRRVVIRRNFKDVEGNGVTADTIWHLYQKNALHSGWISSEFDKGLAGTRTPVGRILHGVNSKAQHLTEGIEDYTRLAHFIDAISKSKATTLEEAAAQAAQEVRKYHFDYSEFTDFEKNVMSRVFPFYKWTRKNIPLMLEMMFLKPGKTTAPIKTLRDISIGMGYDRNGQAIPQGDTVVPQWLRDAMAVPVGTSHTGHTLYENPSLPFNDAMNFLSPTGDLLMGRHGRTAIASNIASALQPGAFMINPMIRTPIELAAGKSVSGQDIQQQGVGKYLAAQSPYTNLIQKLLHPQNSPSGPVATDPNLLQFLLATGIQENTDARMKSEAKREQQAAAVRRKAQQKSKGTFRSNQHGGAK